ncbi:MAG TPA: 4-(cytidine 5'-diphospho)-2-C-methyl-D-erythritol kinase [Treponema sp.]|nr:4-(cytidine 5'-diphospho)-2-C-methyl-D-erythritol kinase [Treponema sp.]
MDSVTVSAPAKINLGLHVLPKRNDGYHGIESIFTTVNLFDELQVSLVKGKGSCTVSCQGMELPAQNTITAAYKAFCVLTGMEQSVSVSLTKCIPSGGGLGGGSSDASSFIQSIDTLFGTHLDAVSFETIASKVGSDVFFFTHALLEAGEGKPYAAIVEGRGEHVSAIPARNDFTVLLLFPGVQVSTAEAYRWVDEDAVSDETVRLPLAQLYSMGVHAWTFKNDFTPCVVRRCPVIGKALADLRQNGADFVEMSGSGSTVYGVFERRECALRAQQNLSSKWKVMVL